MDIGIISEGLTDQIIIESVVQGLMGTKDIMLDPLQPKKGQPGNWPLVVSYCKSKDFIESFPYRDGFTIIHIDCDVLKGDGLPEDCIMQFNNLDTTETFEIVKNKIIEFINLDNFKLFADKIVFAIAIDSTECWFLPLYFSNKPAICNKISGCIGTLNPELIKKEGFYLDAKDPENYRKIAKHFNKKKAIDLCYSKNDSFRLFIDNLDSAIQSYKANN